VSRSGSAALRCRRYSTALKRRARRVEDSGRVALSGWLDDPKVVALVTYFRPDFQTLLKPFGFTDEVDIIAAAGMLTGMTGVRCISRA